jgi:hypothetical protein
MALGSTHPLTEMSIRNLPGGKGRPTRKAANFTAIYRKCGSLDDSQPYGPSQPVTWTSSTLLPIFLGHEKQSKHIFGIILYNDVTNNFMARMFMSYLQVNDDCKYFYFDTPTGSLFAENSG